MAATAAARAIDTAASSASSDRITIIVAIPRNNEISTPSEGQVFGIVTAYAVMAYVVMAYVVMAYVVMAYVMMAYVIMAHHLKAEGPGMPIPIDDAE